MHHYIPPFGGSALKRNDAPELCRSNYWFNCVSCDAKAQRVALTKVLSDATVMTRPILPLMNRLQAFINALCGPLDNAHWLEARVVNLPSSATFPKKVYE